MKIQYPNSSPSVLRDVMVRRPIFRNAMKYCRITPNLHEGFHGYSVGPTMSKVMKASFGEHLERLSLFKSNIRPDSTPNHFEAFHLLTGEIIKVPVHEVLLDYNLPVFQNLSDKSSLYGDTCGIAAHLNSKDAIFNAFIEYIERQSLIQTWLDRRPGERIPLELIKSNTYIERIGHLKDYVDELHFFNISISESMYVILSLGWHGEFFSVGVGADPYFEKALEGSLNEFTMVLEGNITFQRQKKQEQNFHESQLYAHVFYTMSANDFRNKFEFLLQSNLVRTSIHQQEKTNEELIKYVSEELQLSLYCTFIPSFLNWTKEKIVKVFAPEGYPHMNTEILEPEKYKISEMLQNQGFPNKGTHIPFP